MSQSFDTDIQMEQFLPRTIAPSLARRQTLKGGTIGTDLGPKVGTTPTANCAMCHNVVRRAMVVMKRLVPNVSVPGERKAVWRKRGNEEILSDVDGEGVEGCVWGGSEVVDGGLVYVCVSIAR